jgi:hypothetical protein
MLHTVTLHIRNRGAVEHALLLNYAAAVTEFIASAELMTFASS